MSQHELSGLPAVKEKRLVERVVGWHEALLFDTYRAVLAEVVGTFILVIIGLGTVQFRVPCLSLPLASLCTVQYCECAVLYSHSTVQYCIVSAHRVQLTSTDFPGAAFVHAAAVVATEMPGWGSGGGAIHVSLSFGGAVAAAIWTVGHISGAYALPLLFHTVALLSPPRDPTRPPACPPAALSNRSLTPAARPTAD